LGASHEGVLRFEFSAASKPALEEVDWTEFFRVFDERGLELIYDDKPGSRFHKFAYPETPVKRGEPPAPAASKPAKSKPTAKATAKATPRRAA